MNDRLVPRPQDLSEFLQHTFRVALNALSEPGQWLVVPSAETPSGMSPALWALTLTLLDRDVSVYWPSLSETARKNVVFHAEVRLLDSPEAADWVVLSADASDAVQILDRVRVGTHERPDEGATVLWIGGSERCLLDLAGPGIQGVRRCELPLPSSVVARLAENHQRYPLGFDSFVVDTHAVLGLPRSTRIQLEGEPCTSR